MSRQLYSVYPIIVLLTVLSHFKGLGNDGIFPVHKKTVPPPKIQACILLDVSNSMDGLIEQAKGQLWNMVNVLGKIRCNEAFPTIELALYEYGRTENDSLKGFVRQINGFTNIPDSIFRNLTGLTTNGGKEYCGHVIYNALNELNWDTSFSSYKVIFIAGNESFQQGDISFSLACSLAIKKGVIVNTIYCGARDKGIDEFWDLGAECGNGSFNNIDKDARPLSIPTPFDDILLTQREKLNETFIYYGKEGRKYYESLLQADSMVTYNLNDPTKISAYIVVRSNPNIYLNPTWDLVDAFEKDQNVVETVDLKSLPDSLQHKSRKDLYSIVISKLQQRKSIRFAISDLKKKQDDFILAEKKRVQIDEPETLESEIEKIIKEQVGRFNMRFQ